MNKTAIALIISSLAAPALALDPLPEQSGISGFVNLGAGGGSVESNFLARISGIDVDLGDDTIDSLDSPDDEDIAMAAFQFGVGYTFANRKTRISLGNHTADFLDFDRDTELALRHDFDRVGNIQLSFLNSSALQTEVWADPYAAGVKRKDTQFSSNGGSFAWDRIFGSNFELTAMVKDREIDDERSGESLNLGTEQRKLLDREGDVSRFEVAYLARLAGGEHMLRPSVAYIDRDLDGDAMAQDGYEIGLSYVYKRDDVRWVNRVSYASLDADEENPIFFEDNDADTYTIASQIFFPGLFGLKKWEPNLGVVYGESDSDIDFNDTSAWMFTASMFRRF